MALKSTHDKEKVPWLRLLELEVRPPKMPTIRRRGRPSSQFPRSKFHLSFTDTEIAAIDGLCKGLSGRFGTKIARGQLSGFLALYVQSLFQDKDGKMTIPETIHSFSDFFRYLETKTGGE